MGLLLNLALLALGTTATIAAFGGETWLKGEKPLPKRITRRGWLSLACLLLAFVLGGIKELRSQNESEKLQQESDSAKAQLVAANEKISLVSQALASTSERLAAQSNLNLLSVLAKGDPVRDAALWIELGPSSYDATDIVQFLFASISEKYRPVLRAEIAFTPFLGLNAGAVYTYREGRLVLVGASEETFPPRSNDSVRGPNPESEVKPPRFLSRDFPAPPGSIGKRESEPFIFVSKLPKSSKFRNAAIAYRDIAESYSPGQLKLTFERTFASDAERSEFHSQNPGFAEAKAWRTGSELRIEYTIPKEVRDLVSSYWRSAIKKVHYHVYLESAAHLMISANAELDSPKETETSVVAPFKSLGKPELTVGIIAVR